MLVTSHWMDGPSDEEWPKRKSDTRKSGFAGGADGRVEGTITLGPRGPPTYRPQVVSFFFAVACNSRSAALIFNRSAYLNPSNATEGEFRPKSNLISLGLPRYCGAGRAILEFRVSARN